MTKATMFPITPRGHWGKEKPVTCYVSSYTRSFVRLEVTDDAGKAFILNVPREIIAQLAAKEWRERS